MSTNILNKLPTENKRFLAVEDAKISEDRTVELSVSSNVPYLRWFGYEELEHTEAAVNLSRFNDNANVLFNHNRDDYIGVVEKAWLEDGKLYAQIRFDTHSLAEKIYQSVKAGIIRNVSIGYTIEEMVLAKTENDIDTYRVTKWTPLETSLVTVPADATVGVGRTLNGENWENLEREVGRLTERLDYLIEEKDTVDNPVINESDILKAERERTQAILAAGKKYGCEEIATRAIDEGLSIEQARSLFLDKIQQGKQKPIAKVSEPLGMSEKEQKRYSFVRAINAALEGSWKNAGFEKEIHDELVKQAQKTRNYKENGNILIPINDLMVNRNEVIDGFEQLSRSAATRNYLKNLMQRDQMVGDPLLGGNLVETELLEERFIDIFRNRSVMRQAGMQSLTGLVGNVDIPKQIGGAVDGNYVYWVSEDADVGQIDAQFGLVKFRPKNVGAYMYVTRSMLLHSSIGMDNFIRRELAIALALGMDKAAIDGTGTNDMPLGILNTGGVNAVIFGTDGDHPTWERLVNFETRIATANADERTMGWVMNAKLRGELKSRQKFAGTTGETLWQSAMSGSNQGYVNGYRALVSNQIPGNLIKGTGTDLNALIFGDFSRLICAEWGTYELAADPYHKFLSGGVRVRIIHTCDIQVTQEKAFSVATDVATPLSN